AGVVCLPAAHATAPCVVAGLPFEALTGGPCGDTPTVPFAVTVFADMAVAVGHRVDALAVHLPVTKLPLVAIAARPNVESPPIKLVVPELTDVADATGEGKDTSAVSLAVAVLALVAGRDLSVGTPLRNSIGHGATIRRSCASCCDPQGLRACQPRATRRDSSRWS